MITQGVPDVVYDPELFAYSLNFSRESIALLNTNIVLSPEVSNDLYLNVCIYSPEVDVLIETTLLTLLISMECQAFYFTIK